MASPKPKPQTRTMYMHTLDGQPASYKPGYQVFFAQQGRYARKGARLAESLGQIRAEQRASEAWRVSQGYRPSLYHHSYVLVEVPRG